jgi:MFS family permease
VTTEAPPVPLSRRGMVGLLTAQGVSLSGTRLSAIALPWFVLVSTGSATRTGLVAFCEMAPYVVVKALGGPLVDRAGPRRVSIGADLASAPLVGAVPLLHALGLLPFWLLLPLVAAAGAMRGPGDGSKSALVPEVTEAAGVPVERFTGLFGMVERLTSTVGPLLAGVLIAWVGPLAGLVVDALSFAAAAGIVALTAPRRDRAPKGEDEPYLRRLATGFEFLRRDRLLRSLAGMVAVTNLIDAGVGSVLVPVWARETGNGPGAVGLLYAALSITAVAGSAVAAAVAHRLPRRAVYFAGFAVGGAPRIAVLALGAPLWMVAAISAVSGFGLGFLNPVIGAVRYERIPRHLLGRVDSLVTTLAWAGIPLGGPVAGLLVALVGLNPALLACAAGYLAVTTLPALRPQWRGMDAGRRREVAVTAPPRPAPSAGRPGSSPAGTRR